jgi:hypothetical protein
MVEVPVGEGSYPYLRTGFHALEVTDSGTMFRWTDGNSRITVPWLDRDVREPISCCLHIDLSPWRPAKEPSAHLTVEVEDEQVFARVMDKGSGRSTLTIPVRSVANRGEPDLEIEILTDTWRTHESAQSRDLGIVFYGMRVTPFRICKHDRYFGKGFHDWEQTGMDKRFRWTDGDALVTMTWPGEQEEGPTDLCLRMELIPWRPEDVSAAHLRVEAEGVTLFEGDLGKTMEPLHLYLSAQGLDNRGEEALEIRLLSDTWSPQGYSGGEDRRELGIMLQDLRLAPFEECEDGGESRSDSLKEYVMHTPQGRE